MYNKIQDIERELAALEEDKEGIIFYLLEQGESDRNFNLPLQHTNNFWYILGWHDRDYQIEIGFDPEPVIFEHF